MTAHISKWQEIDLGTLGDRELLLLADDDGSILWEERGTLALLRRQRGE